ncbi:MAG: LamB/YcsF family protein [Proteobacteria bacterium]|nr:LamB/YcsF family protein [Pseudomonadota bacterium]
MKIDLNCDMGESFGAYTLGMDSAIIASVSSANIACGFHAGDPQVMRQTVELALKHGVGIGAHPGFPDLLGFGRRNMDCGSEEIEAYLIYQIGALQAFCTAHGTRLSHVKPHGALYNMAVGNDGLIRSIARAIAQVDSNLFMVALAGPHADHTAEIAEAEGIITLFEAFPDRAYTPEGTLVSRRLPGAVIHDPEEAAARAVRMAVEGVVVAVDGTGVPLKVHTLCVHGDNPNGVALAATIRSRLEAAEVAVIPMAESLLR